MKLLRKTWNSPAGVVTLAVLFFFAVSTTQALQAQEKRCALHSAANRSYVSTAPSGGIDLSGNAVTDKTTFVIIDPKGGALQDGDEIEIKYVPGTSTDPGKNKPSFWVEQAGKITRLNDEPQGGAGKFKLKKQGDAFVLQTASGKFVAAPQADGGLGLADSAAGALALTFQEVK